MVDKAFTKREYGVEVIAVAGSERGSTRALAVRSGAARMVRPFRLATRIAERTCEDPSVITNDAELEQARKNLANVEAAIESLRKELLPDHERNFYLYARPWLDFQDEFQADIDAYLVNGPAPGRTPRTGIGHSRNQFDVMTLDPVPVRQTVIAAIRFAFEPIGANGDPGG